MNFFIPDLTKYYLRYGDDDSKWSDEVKKKFQSDMNYINNSLKNILDDEFYLLYNGNGGFTSDSVGNMSVQDRTWMVNKLISTIKEYNEQLKNLQNK